MPTAWLALFWWGMVVSHPQSAHDGHARPLKILVIIAMTKKIMMYGTEFVDIPAIVDKFFVIQ